MRIFTDIASHDTAVPPGHAGGRIVRTDSTPEFGSSTTTNGQFIFQVPEGAALTVNRDSFFFPQEDTDSISSKTAAEFLIRYPMYDHILYNFYLDNADPATFSLSVTTPQPTITSTTPALPTSLIPMPNASPRCQIGRATGATVGMVPNSLAILPKSTTRASPVYGALATETIDLWPYNPFYIDVTASPAAPSVISIAGFPLAAVAGVRTPGLDNYNNTAPTSAIALDIVAAINDVANSFSTFVLATIDPVINTRVQLRPIPSTATTVTLGAPPAGLSVSVSHPGTDEVMMWWKVARMSTTQDQVSTSQGPAAGDNTPALVSLTEIDREDSSLLVYASVDDGASWYRIPYLTPIDLFNAGTELRIAFLNTGEDKIYLLGFCILFPDLLAPL